MLAVKQQKKIHSAIYLAFWTRTASRYTTKCSPQHVKLMFTRSRQGPALWLRCGFVSAICNNTAQRPHQLPLQQSWTKGKKGFFPYPAREVRIFFFFLSKDNVVGGMFRRATLFWQMCPFSFRTLIIHSFQYKIRCLEVHRLPWRVKR